MEMNPERKERFMKAWKDAQVLMKMRDLELSMLLAQMAAQVEVHADMSNDDAYESNELDANGAFDMAVDYIEDMLSRPSLEWYFKDFAEEMKVFGTKKVVQFVPKLPS